MCWHCLIQIPSGSHQGGVGGGVYPHEKRRGREHPRNRRGQRGGHAPQKNEAQTNYAKVIGNGKPTPNPARHLHAKRNTRRREHSGGKKGEKQPEQEVETKIKKTQTCAIPEKKKQMPATGNRPEQNRRTRTQAGKERTLDRNKDANTTNGEIRNKEVGKCEGG